MKDNRLLLIGLHVLPLAVLFAALSVLARLLPLFPGSDDRVQPALQDLSFASFALFLALVVVNILFRRRVGGRWLSVQPVSDMRICVAMTAYNDELSIGDAVRDFIAQDHVEQVIVVDNNSTDRTTEEAARAGARAVRESVQGFGACCIRALREAHGTGCNIICLVEGDGTFTGADLRKMTAYIENGDMVLGTRTTRELNTPDSQMSAFIQWGNIFMAKLLQVRFWKVRLTDVGCTFRLIRREALERIFGDLTTAGNPFLCEMNLSALRENLKVIEVPVTFRKRVGESKGVGNSIPKALVTGLQMWRMILAR